jgi:LysM repeat protein
MPIQAGIRLDKGNNYAVLPKDSLFSIGRRYCVSAAELAGYNNIKATKPIQPGQILRLPQKACN